MSVTKARDVRPILWGLVFVVLVLALVVVLSGCDSNADGTGDAPVGKVTDEPWDIVNAPDGYPNVATRCNPYVPGTRLYVVTHGKSDVPPLVVTDEQCR